MPRRPALIPAVALLLHAPALSRDDLRRHQSRLVRRLVRHAYERVPFYRRHFDRAGIRPEDIGGVDDLARIPLVERAEFRLCPPHDVVARGFDPAALVSRRTSGSSGQPFRTYRTWFEQNLLHLFRLRAQRSVGVRSRDRLAAIGGPEEIHPRDTKILGRLLAGFGFRRRTWIDMYADPVEILARIAAAGADCITGYPGVLARVADVAREQPSFLPPRVLMCGAERLTPPLRRRIETGFRAPVRDFYGCHECNLVGWECQAMGLLHTSDDTVIVEVLRDGRPVAEGETGEVVITSLHHYAMPFVRYRLGDLAVRGPVPCPCGSPFATLSRIDGRTFDDFLLDSRRVQAQAIGLAIVNAVPWVGQYQFTQERADRIVFRVTPEPEDLVPDLEPVRAAAAAALGPAIEFEIMLTRDFPVEPNGKIRVFRSLVTAPREK